ncbi:Re/Si-specific NAD(P)(+) transhydrogenase subunit alpha [Panacibacter sp. DH6]|uniref:NAD(P) transhydrogenase subunit alpha part 1 n=1 Tax=Panacibacter microcysteis TaxID=2793269 RepID=A0A931GYT3_9BACT|nr:Re/Si-specific NAD(P)(+) transhydrogenase subunit alpha [Panacibacter microcysteis]MBG9377652.1 Re/Si-specific NAD(P)(+) transhydrogenase subunit alpha [Panacibacter microcysteis]
MIAGIIKEPTGEHRVALMPEQAEALVKKNVIVYVEPAAGVSAFASDDIYLSKGAQIKPRSEILASADIILSVNPLPANDISLLQQNTVLIGAYQPLINHSLIKQVCSQQCTLFSMDMLPRTTRAQSMDILSSQANIAGYKAVLLAASLYPRYFPMFMTAAGSIPPAKVLILGAGVAGLQAIATARRLGAVVEVFDTRPAVKEEVMSLGAKFIDVEGAADASAAGGYAVEQDEAYKQRQQQKISEAAVKADIIITTAQIPGRAAPVLIPEAVLMRMKPGSVIIDLAAATGGNTAKTVNDQTVHFNNVTIVGNSNLPAGMPADASKLYGKNILNFLQLIIGKEGALSLNFDDDLVKGTCIVHNGAVVNERVKSAMA